MVIARFLPVLLIGLIMSCSSPDYAEYRVLVDPDTVTAPAGVHSFLTIRVEIPKGHHIYGNPKGPGRGKPTEVLVTQTPGFTFEAARFLPPQKFTDPDDDFTWGYAGETTIFIPFTPSSSQRDGVTTIPITVETLLCSDTSCIPRNFSLTATVKVTPAGTAAYHWSQRVLEAYRLSAAPPSVTSTPPQQREQIRPGSVARQSSTIGILADMPLTPRTIDEGIGGLLQAILLSLIAGLILNFMPCVLPVVSLKVMHFVQHAERSKRELVLLGLLFVAGIITSFLALASLAAFLGYNWGGLFQHRLYLIVMTALMFAMALSFFGVFTMTPPSIAGKLETARVGIYADAYFKGIIATLMATPCSGPFLGGALAWALTRPATYIFAIFLSIGIGMASPYLLLILRPGLLKHLPKPGEWMHVIERIMAFLLMFTVVYLLSILEQQAVLPMVSLLAFIGLALWIYGSFGGAIHNRLQRLVTAVIAVTIIAGGYFFSFQYAFDTRHENILPQTAFSEERLLQNRTRSTISMVNFTADWCPNCRLVERITLHQPSIARLLRERGVDFMTADITVSNPALDQLMKRLQSPSIPLLVIFPAGSDFTKPICLRDIYSEKDIVRALDMAGRSSSKADQPTQQLKYQVEIK